jgi:hypothetical protein
MRKIFNTVAIIISFLILLVCSACTSSQDDDKTNNSQPDICTIYLDDSERVVDGLSIKISCSESWVSYTSENRSLTIKLVFMNMDTADREINLVNMQLLHIESGVVYDLSPSLKTSIKLQYGIERQYTFSATIPISYQKAEYVLSFSAGKDYEFYLYERPDELREDRQVKFVLNNEVVHTLTVKKGRSISEMYIWENPNHLTHCAEWFMDDKYKTELLKTTKINEDMTVYGKISSNIRTSTIFILEIKHVPSDGIVVISGDGATHLSSSVICNNSDIKEIYLPKGLKNIYLGNFVGVPNLQKIHFAGSEEEWGLITSRSTIPANVIIVYNSVFQN